MITKGVCEMMIIPPRMQLWIDSQNRLREMGDVIPAPMPDPDQDIDNYIWLMENGGSRYVESGEYC